MNIGKIFGATFFSVLAALIVYDMAVKGVVGGLLNKYDDTFEPSGKKDGQYFIAEDGKVYRVKSAA